MSREAIEDWLRTWGVVLAAMAIGLGITWIISWWIPMPEGGPSPKPKVEQHQKYDVLYWVEEAPDGEISGGVIVVPSKK